MIKNVIIALVISIVGMGIINLALTKTDKQNCIKWQAEQKQIKDYFVTDWQREQCQYYQIILKP